MFVQNIEISKKFYHTLLGQKIEMDSGAYIGFAGGFGLWEGRYALETIFERKRVSMSYGLQNCELYFESEELETLIDALHNAAVEFIHDIREHPWGQRAFRIFDPDGHIVEFGEPMSAVVKRYRKAGKTNEDIQKLTTMPMEFIQSVH